MKKILTLAVVALMLALTLVLPVSAALDRYMGSQPAADFAKIIHDYGVITNDPRDLIVALFGIEKSEIKTVEEPFDAENVMYGEWIQIWSEKETAEDAAKYYNDQNEFLTVYYFDFNDDNADAHSADIRLYVQQWVDNYPNADHPYENHDYYTCAMTLHANKLALTEMDEAMRQYVLSIDTPKKVFGISGQEVPNEYYNIEAYQSSALKVNGSYDTEYFNPVSKTWRIGNVEDSFANDCTYFVSPYKVKILRAFNEIFSEYGTDPTYGYKLNGDSSRYELTVNYSASGGVEEGDYLDYTVDNIEIEVGVSCLDLDAISSPQTGFATVAYAAVAVVSAAAVVAVGKKRR